MPSWLLCRSAMIDSLHELGIMTLSPFITRSPLIESSSLKSQYVWAILGTCLHFSGQLFSVSLCTVDKIGSRCVSSVVLVNQLLENVEIDITLTRRSSWISELFALDGKWLNASASNISFPGQYVMTISYCCRHNNILCNWAGAEMRFFMLIISRGLWSVLTMNDLLYMYVWNFSHLKTMANSSLSMLAYLVSSVHQTFTGKCYGLTFLQNACS